MRIRPTADHVLVRRDKPKSESELVITPDNYQKAPVMGIVTAVGPGAYQDDGTTRPMMLIVGDHVLFARHAGQPVIVDGDELILMSEGDVQAVVED